MIRRAVEASTRLRIALILPGYAAATEEHWAIPALRHHVRSLAAAHDVRIYALRYPDLRPAWTLDGAVVRTFGGARARGLAGGRLLARAVAGITAELRAWRPHVLHGLWADEPGAVAAAAGRLLGVPSIVSLMGGELCAMRDIGYGGLLSRSNSLLLRYALREASAVTAGSRYLANTAAPHMRGGQPVLLPLGVDTTWFHPGTRQLHDTVHQRHDAVRSEDARFRLLHVGSLTPVKDALTIVHALARLRVDLPGAHLDIVGDGPLRESIIEASARLGIAGAVTLHGRSPHRELPAMYRAADVVVQSSLHESQGMAIVEAAACGRPVVGTAVGILPELPGARTIPAGDADALAAALRTLLDQPGARAAAGIAARAFVARELDLARTAGAAVELYRRTCASRLDGYSSTSL